MLWTHFFPLFVLTILQALVYFSDGTKSDKLGNVATILLAILSYQLVYRQSIPVIAKTTLGDKHVLASLSITLVAAIDAFVNGKKESEAENKNEEWTWPNWVSLGIFVAVAFYFPIRVYI